MKSSKRALDPIEEAYLYGHPNPDRVDCPDDEVLRGLASKHLPISHPARKHIVRCSPCWQEFRSFEAQLRQTRRLRLVSIIAALLLISIASFWMYRRLRSERINPVIAYEQNHASVRTPPGILNYQTIAAARGGHGSSAAQTKEQIVSRSVRELAIVLPTGREAGTYVLDVSPEPGGKELASYVGHASIDNDGITTLHTPVDFRLFSPGTYTLSWHLLRSEFVQSGRFILQ